VAKIPEKGPAKLPSHPRKWFVTIYRKQPTLEELLERAEAAKEIARG
jgi:hypothetical protein